MKKSAIALSIFSLALFSMPFAHAEEAFDQPEGVPQPQFQRGEFHEEFGGQNGEGDQRERRGRGMKDGQPKMGMGAGMMMQQVVATSDGGVVIVSGHKIAKYDANLNLVNEVELKKDKGSKPRSAEAKIEARAEVVTEIPSPAAPVESQADPMPAAEPLTQETPAA